MSEYSISIIYSCSLNCLFKISLKKEEYKVITNKKIKYVESVAILSSTVHYGADHKCNFITLE